jgi:hypothetical protein
MPHLWHDAAEPIDVTGTTYRLPGADGTDGFRRICQGAGHARPPCPRRTPARRSLRTRDSPSPQSVAASGRPPPRRLPIGPTSAEDGPGGQALSGRSRLAADNARAACNRSDVSEGLGHVRRADSGHLTRRGLCQRNPSPPRPSDSRRSATRPHSVMRPVGPALPGRAAGGVELAARLQPSAWPRHRGSTGPVSRSPPRTPRTSWARVRARTRSPARSALAGRTSVLSVL